MWRRGARVSGPALDGFNALNCNQTSHTHTRKQPSCGTATVCSERAKQTAARLISEFARSLSQYVRYVHATPNSRTCARIRSTPTSDAPTKRIEVASRATHICTSCSVTHAHRHRHAALTLVAGAGIMAAVIADDCVSVLLDNCSCIVTRLAASAAAQSPFRVRPYPYP